MIRNLILKGFRSFKSSTSIVFEPLTALVGPNGAGKSNILGALDFVSTCMKVGLEGAVSACGGIEGLRHRDDQHPTYDIELHVAGELEAGGCLYHLRISGMNGDYKVAMEDVAVERGQVRFLVEDGQWKGPSDLKPAIAPRSLVLPLLSGDPRFAPLFNALKHIAVYEISPGLVGRASQHEARHPIDRRGQHWASVLKEQLDPTWRADLIGVLHKLTGDIDDIRFQQASDFLAAEFRHRRADGGDWWLPAHHESDGTLRVVGLMAALLQRPTPELIAIEEPELNLHPGVMPLIYDYVHEASQRGQVIVTTQDPDFLSLMAPDQVRMVSRVDGETRVTSIDENQIEGIRQKLFSMADIMRIAGSFETGSFAPERDG
jgi:hypothetical protein